MSPHWKTHSNKRLWFSFTTGLDWGVVFIRDHILCADWILWWCWCCHYVHQLSHSLMATLITRCPFGVQKTPKTSWTKRYHKQTQWIAWGMMFDGKLRFSCEEQLFGYSQCSEYRCHKFLSVCTFPITNNTMKKMRSEDCNGLITCVYISVLKWGGPHRFINTVNVGLV